MASQRQAVKVRPRTKTISNNKILKPPNRLPTLMTVLRRTDKIRRDLVQTKKKMVYSDQWLNIETIWMRYAIMTKESS